MEAMRTAVVGVGGLGGYFGGRLARAGEDVTFIARGATLEALVERGLDVRSVYGDFRVFVKATDDPASVGAVDLVLFVVKTYDTDAAAADIAPLVGSETAILSLQNGVGNAERVREVVGRGHPLGGVAYVEAAVESAGVIAQLSQVQRVIVGELGGGGSDRVERIVGTFRDAGIDVQLSRNVVRDMWTKWTFICGYSGVTTVTRQPAGPILATPETRELFLAAMREVAAVGRARGIGLDADVVANGLRSAEGFAPTAKSSMQRDAERGRPLEIEALNGRVAAYGHESAVPTPVNAFIYAALLPAHRAALAARGEPVAV